jgi:serine/threonine protein kinase
MEYMPRGDLYEILANRKQVLKWPLRYQITIQTAKGLAFLHGGGILHGDVKSPNILLDEKWNVKICDFGFSLIKSDPSPYLVEARVQGRLRCSPYWLQPERVKNKFHVYTEACDIFSFGQVMGEIASRKLPHHDAKSVTNIAEKLINNEYEPLPEDCPEEYAKWAECATSFIPEDRPSAKMIYEGLEQAEPPEEEFCYLVF